MPDLKLLFHFVDILESKVIMDISF